MTATCEKPKEFVEPLDYHIYNPQADKAVGFINQLTHGKGFTAGQKFNLRPWQEFKIIRPIFGLVKEDPNIPPEKWLRLIKTAFLEIPRKNGKALALDTPIPTPDGWRMMGELKVGDKVFDELGKSCNVVAVTEVMHGRECFRVTFSDKTSIVADAEHQWLTETRKPEHWHHVWTTEQIRSSLKINRTDGGDEFNHRIQVAKPLELPTTSLPVDPYVLGAWLGDGTSRWAGFTCSHKDLDVVEQIRKRGITAEECGPQKPGVMTAILGATRRHGRKQLPGVSLHVELKNMGLLGNKHIPQIYLRASREQRMALLQGLMDTDGYASKAGQCEFTSTSKALRDGFLELARSLGFKPSLKEARATIGGLDCGVKYRIQFWAFSDEPVFKLERKAARLKKRPSGRTRSMTRRIVSVEPIESVPVKCIQVDSPKSLYLAGEAMVPTHNSEIAGAIAVKGLCADGEQEGEVYIAASDKDQASIVFNAAAGMIRRHPTLSKKCKIIDSRKRIIYKPTNSVMVALSKESLSKEGYNPSLVVFDEIHAQKDRKMWEVLTDARGSRDQFLTVAITTSGFDPSTLWGELREYAEKVRDGEIIDPAFLPILFTAPKQADWKDRKLWFQTNPALGDFKRLEDFEDMFQQAQHIPSRQNRFRQVQLCQETEQQNRWLDLDLWKACEQVLELTKFYGRRVWLGLDLASTTDIAALVMIIEANKEEREQGIECFAYPFFFVPRENMRERGRIDQADYPLWSEQGFLTATDGDTIDYDYIFELIKTLNVNFNIQNVLIDRHNATYLSTKLMQELTKEKVTMHGQSITAYSPGTKDTEKLLLSKRIVLHNSPVWRWMAGNVCIERDARDNIKPIKPEGQDKKRIDGIAALVMARSGMITQEEEPDYNAHFSNYTM